MKTRHLLTLTMVLLFAAGLWGLAGLLDSGESGTPPVLQSTGTPPEPELAPTATPSALSDGGAAPVAVAEDRSAVGAESAESENFDLEGALWVEGRVNSPLGIPADEEATILVVVFAPDEQGQADRRALRDELDDEYPNATEIAGELTPLGGHEKLESARWSRRPILSDGSFRIPVPANGAEVYAVVDARYLYQKNVYEGDRQALANGVEAMVVEVGTGAWITGTCSPPASQVSMEMGEMEATLSGRPDDESGGFRGLFSWGADFARKEEVGAELTFEFRGLPSDLVYGVGVSSDEMLDFHAADLKFQPGEHRNMEAIFAMGARISGRVVDDAGEPVEQARVQVGGVLGGMSAMMSNQMGRGRVSAKTDEDGLFHIKGAIPKPMKLSAGKKGYLLGQTDELPLAEGVVMDNVEIVLGSGHRIAGLVQWPDGTPVDRARVRVETDSRSMGFSIGAMLAQQNNSGRTDEEGRFELTGLGEGPFTVRASASPPRANEDPVEPEPAVDEAVQELVELGVDIPDRDDDDRPRWRVSRENVASGTLDLVLFLEQPSGVAGRVVDDLGAPIEEFSVEATRQGSGGNRWTGNRSVESDFQEADGSFFLDGLDAGTWMVSAQAPKHSGPVAVLQITSPHTGPPLEIVLPRAAHVSGMVLDPSGNPVEGASVEANRSVSSRTGWARDRAQTDAEGSFRIDDLHTGPVSVSASSDEWAKSLPLTLDLAPATYVNDVVLTLRMGGTLTGEVFGVDGKPEANRTVQLIGPSERGDGSITTDDQGWFEVMHLTPGKYQVMVEPSREAVMEMMESGEEPDIGAIFSSLKMASAEIIEGETTHVLLGEEPKEPVLVTGTVTESGKPVGGVMVAAISEGGNVMSGMGISQTREDGSYKLTLKRPGPTVFSVQAFGDSDIQFYEDVPAGETYTLDLALPLGSISGTVYGPGGKPVAGVPVRANQSGGVFSLSDLGGGGGRGGSSTDERGNYSFIHLTPGTYTVRAGGFGTGFSSAQPRTGVAIRGDVSVHEDEETSGVDLSLTGAARLLGTVVDAAGEPAAGASLFVYAEGGQVVSPLSACSTDARGRFIYDGISPGTYSVTAILDSTCSPMSAPVRVDAGADPDIRLRLAPGTTLIVQLQDREGDAIRARVRVLDADGREVGTRMAANRMSDLLGEGFSTREQRFGPLPAGKYRVIATANDGRDANKPVTLKGQDERSVKLRLK